MSWKFDWVLISTTQSSMTVSCGWCAITRCILCVFGLVALGAGGLYGRTTACVECLFLKRGKVCIKPHFAAQGIQFKYKMAFGKAADRGIARHSRDGVDQASDEQRPDAHAGCNQCSLSTRMASTDNNDVKLIVHGTYYTTRMRRVEG